MRPGAWANRAPQRCSSATAGKAAGRSNGRCRPGFKPEQSPLAGQLTPAGAGVLVGTVSTEGGGSHQALLVRKSGGAFLEAPRVPAEGETLPAGEEPLLKEGETLFGAARAPVDRSARRSGRRSRRAARAGQGRRRRGGSGPALRRPEVDVGGDRDTGKEQHGFPRAGNRRELPDERLAARATLLQILLPGGRGGALPARARRRRGRREVGLEAGHGSRQRRRSRTADRARAGWQGRRSRSRSRARESRRRSSPRS